jgi:hypothetical protein
VEFGFDGMQEIRNRNRKIKLMENSAQKIEILKRKKVRRKKGIGNLKQISLKRTKGRKKEQTDHCYRKQKIYFCEKQRKFRKSQLKYKFL